MTVDAIRRRPTAEELFHDVGAVKMLGYPHVEPTHKRWALQQAGWPTLTPEEAFALCEINGDPT